MHTRNTEAFATPSLGGRLAVVVFICTLLAFVGESQLTQVSVEMFDAVHILLTSPKYVQSNLGYRQPFFILSEHIFPDMECKSN